MSYAARIALRHTPDDGQVQVLLGTLLGRGRLVADPDGVRLVVVMDERHAWLADWTYQRIAPLALPPQRVRGRVLLRSATHALFADLAEMLERPARLLAVVGRDGLWVWAMYARVSGCERSRAPCVCAPATPLRLRTLRRAS
jgi:hypothetical protein